MTISDVMDKMRNIRYTGRSPGFKKSHSAHMRSAMSKDKIFSHETAVFSPDEELETIC